ncbi:cytochrome c oxidase subunit 3 family protein [Skermanella rosea]|uniref:cytochrome c oxidase subunit 3 family protein n=1 Tax=Skermanella rosea TaxID=1817965 RepID=UPI001931D75B|nr:cytochrome c oxidase subunit 3 family protein [Skermanella rosea]UEM01803.1 cytochrome c oxidase subunit 3 family protein [Skermanella rosea]
MPDIRPEPQYATLEQQADVAVFGMWIFLATEVLFFGGMLFAYTVYRGVYPEGFAEAGRHTKIVIGTVNTVILLTSSFVVAWAVHLAERGRGRGVAVLLGVAALLGTVFLGLKGFEYYQEWHEGLVPGLRFEETGPHAHAMELFYLLYFMMTGVHGFHVTIGIGLMATMAVRAWRGAFSSAYHTPVEITGLYWHFVDIVWIFLYPLIYLVGRSGG